jgi:hypothetical protein
MKIKQLSIFLENKPGRLSAPARALAGAGLNIATMSLADTQEFGILRLIVREWEKAEDVLEKAGCVVNVTEVLAVEVPDRPGGLLHVLEAAEQAALNVEYTYAFACTRGEKAVLVFRFEDPDRALAELQRRDISVVDQVGLFARFAAGSILVPPDSE